MICHAGVLHVQTTCNVTIHVTNNNRNQWDGSGKRSTHTHVQVWIPLQPAPYIVTHNHPYISSCSRYQQDRLAATYVGMFMCDNVGC